MMGFFTEQLLFPLLGTIITGAIALAAAKFTQLSGIQIEAKHRDALHSALMTGARAAVKAAGGVSPAAGGGGGPAPASPQLLIGDAVRYAEKSVPQALKRLNPPSDVLADLARSKVQEVLSELRK